MSKLVAVGVFDIAAQFFHPPIFFRTTGAAMRWFEDSVKDPKSQDLHFHPEHFQLFELGEFDDFTGLFVPLTPPQLMVNAALYKTND